MMKKIGLTIFCLSLIVIFAWANPPAADNHGEVARGIFTVEIDEREPAGELDAVPADADRIFFFTELRNLDGHTVTHRWKYNGEVKAEVELNVGSDRWRTWSSKSLDEDHTGGWTVEVVDGEGETVGTYSIDGRS